MNSPLEVSRERLLEPGQLDPSTLDNLLRGVAAHEGKALLVGKLRFGISLGTAGLHREFLDMQGNPPVFVGSPSNQRGWCKDSLEPAGIVELVPAENEEYRLTELGDSRAKASAGHILQLSLDAGDKFALRHLFGVAKKTQTKQTSSPMDRIKTVGALLNYPDLTAADISKQAGVCPNTAVNNLKWLAEHNIIEYTSIDSRELAGKQSYEIPDDYDSTTSRQGMAKIVIETVGRLRLQQGQLFTVKDLMDDVRTVNPEVEIDTRNRKKHAIMIINELVKENKLKKGDIDGNTKSKTVLLAGMRAIVRRSVEISEAMLSDDDDFLNEGKNVLDGILDDKEAVHHLVTKWYKESPATSKLPREVSERLLTGFIQNNPGSNTEELAQALKREGLTFPSVKNTLNGMRKAGSLRSAKLDSRNHWYLVEQQPPQQ